MNDWVPVSPRLVRRLWLSVGGAFFFLMVSTAHGAFVPGFDPWHQSVSALSLAPRGPPLAFAVRRTRSIFVAIVAHVAINVLFLLMLVSSLLGR